jgi:hypothetical protein
LEDNAFKLGLLISGPMICRFINLGMQGFLDRDWTHQEKANSG